MPPAPYPDFRWFFRTVRVLPVIAIAALAGGMIGGFSVFAIDLALRSPPNGDVHADIGKKGVGKINEVKANGTVPMRTFDAAGFTPAGGTSAPPTPAPANSTAQPQAAGIARPSPAAVPQGAPQIAVTPPPSAQQKVWPDALSRAHQVVPNRGETPTAKPEMAPAAPPATVTQAARDHAVAPAPASSGRDAEKPAPAKRRVAIKHRPQAAPSENTAETSSRFSRPVYDHYGRDDQRAASDDEDSAGTSYEAAPPRYIVRRQHPELLDRSEDRSDDRSADRSDERDDDLPAQSPPPPPFFGLFGFGDR